jgi:hypothetical protein
LATYRGLSQEEIAGLSHFGLSALANITGAIKYAKYMDLGENDVVMTVATDGAAMYETELQMAEKKIGDVDKVKAAEIFGKAILGAGTDNMIELTRPDRERIFNLGYYTWVEQQGTTLEEFDRRRDQSFWNGLMDLVPIWDGMIERFNAA